MGCAAIHAATTRAAAATTAPAEQRDAIGLDLGRVSLVTVLVVPLPRLQAALDVALLTLRQILLQRLGLFAPQHHPVPLGFFLSLLVLVVPHLGSREVQRGDSRSARRVAELGVAAEV